MAEAQFIPAAPPGFAMDSAIQGAEAGQSMMMRASQLRQQKQMETLRSQQIMDNTVLAPLRAAEARAKIVSAGSSITNHTEMENLKSQAAAASVDANKEFIEATKLADWDTQSTELSRLQAKYSWMNNVRDDKGNSLYAPFLKTVDEARANAILRAKVDKELEASEERARIMAGSRLDVATVGAGTRKEVAEIAAGNRKDVATIGADSRKEVAGITAGSRLEVADKNIEARKDIADASHDTSMDRTEVRGLNQAAIQADREALKLAEEGDEDGAAHARHVAVSFRIQAKKAAEASKNPPAAAPAKEGGAQAPKLYTPPAEEGQSPTFTAAVKTPDDVLSAMQQMVNDGVISVDQARATLEKLGFKKKGK